MIERFYAKNLIGFDTIDLRLKPNLVAVTGPSGAGKSVFMGALLALFGLGDVQAEVAECVLSADSSLDLQSYESDEDIVVRSVKKDKIRFFLNDLTISKKRLQNILSPLIRHISQRSNKELSSDALLALIDDFAAKSDPKYLENLTEFSKYFIEYKDKTLKLEKLKSDEQRVKELIEFAEFEISKIDAIDPKIDEDNSLMDIKRALSKKEKLSDAVMNASQIFDFESKVHEALDLMESDSDLFDEAMNLLREKFDRAQENLDELEEVNVEEVLERIEALASLKRRYGSIEETLAYKQEKIKELNFYKNIDHERGGLEEEVESLWLKLEQMAESISQKRRHAAPELENAINPYLSSLRMPSLKLIFDIKTLDANGKDIIDLDLQGASIDKLSGGEFNRIRLALLLIQSRIQSDGGILLIDEIDANVSGDESIAIAKLLKELSNSYQIIAISHQPHLSAAANQHILVTKEGMKSIARILREDERIDEISRMIAGEKGMKEAHVLAKNLLMEFK